MANEIKHKGKDILEAKRKRKEGSIIRREKEKERGRERRIIYTLKI